jgi:general secretion pathway protein J
MKRLPAGFTLLEMLAAIVVFGFVVAGLAQGTSFGLAAWRQQARATEAHDGMDATDRVLRRLIAQMDPGGQVAPPQIRGTANSLAFTSRFPAPANGGGPVPIDARLQLDGAHRLVLAWAPHLNVQWLGAPPAATEAVLAEGLRGVTFSYWSGAAWQRDWNEPVLPVLLRIHLEFSPGDGRHWPDIIAAPRRQRPE